MAGLFENILTNIKEKKQEGKLKTGYRFSDDGKLSVGGGYYDDDKMFEVEIGKDNANILFKKKFKDGGSTNGSGDAALSAKVKELMEDGYDFGEAVKEAMRQGYKDGGITTPKRGLVDGPGSYSGETAYANIQKLGIETQIKQLYASGIGAKTIAERLKNLYKGQPNIANKINRTLIGDYLTYAKRNLGLVKPVGDIAVRNQYGPIRTLEQVQKIIDAAPKIKKGDKYYHMNAKDLEGRSQWNHTDPKQSRDGKKGKAYLTRKEIMRYNEKGKTHKLEIKGPSKITLIGDAKYKSNVRRGEKTKIADANAGPETVALNKKLSTKYVTEQNNKLRQDLQKNPSETINKIRNNKNIMFQLEANFDSKTGEFSSEKVSNKKLKTLIKKGMFSIEHTSPMAAGAKNTNFTTNLSLITNRANSKIMKPLDTFMNSNSYKDFTDPRVVKIKDFLVKNNLRVKIKDTTKTNNEPFYFGDETTLTAEERLAKQNDFLKNRKPKKTTLREKFNSFNDSFRSNKPLIQNFSSKVPGSALALAPTEFALSLAAGVPLYDAAASAGSYLLKDPALGKAINIPLALRSMTNYEDADEMIKRANERREGIESVLQNAPSKAKNYLMNSKRTRPVRYGNIEDYLPDGDFSGIKSLK